MSQPRINALLRERAQYERAGKPERVALVDAELKRIGFKQPKPDPESASTVEADATPEAAADPTAVETAMQPKRRGR